MENKHIKFKNIIDAMEADFDKFYNRGVNAAGTRVRKHLQELAGLCKETRKEVTEIKNSKKVIL